MTITPAMIEAGAKALFKHIWPKLQRADGKNTWETTDQKVRDGLMAEARAVLIAALS